MMSVALAHIDCLTSGLRASADRRSLCPVCGGTGFAVGPIDYPSFENRRCCSECEAGQRIADRILEIVARHQSGELAHKSLPFLL